MHSRTIHQLGQPDLFPDALTTMPTVRRRKRTSPADELEEHRGDVDRAIAALRTRLEAAIEVTRDQLGTVDHDDPETEIAVALDELEEELEFALREASRRAGC